MEKHGVSKHNSAVSIQKMRGCPYTCALVGNIQCPYKIVLVVKRHTYDNVLCVHTK